MMKGKREEDDVVRIRFCLDGVAYEKPITWVNKRIDHRASHQSSQRILDLC
ncbi:hypothetical protein Drorol1_Dr00020464, partial [Drosera rotundifolia]